MAVLESLTEEDIFYNIRVRGYPLFGTEKTNGVEIPIEELIVHLLKSHKDARCIEGIPVMIQKNDIDFEALYNKALELEVVNAVGWILDETLNAFERVGIIEKVDLLKSWLQRFYDSKSSLEYILSTSSVPEFIEFSRRTRSELARKWGVVARYDAQSFDKKLRTYRNVPTYR